MKHILGNTPQCWSCKYYEEGIEEKQKRSCWNAGWCTNEKALSKGINGRKRKNPPKREPVNSTSSCYDWIDADSGYTHFEVMTGYSEPYDGTKIDFSEEQQKFF